MYSADYRCMQWLAIGRLVIQAIDYCSLSLLVLLSSFCLYSSVIFLLSHPFVSLPSFFSLCLPSPVSLSLPYFPSPFLLSLHLYVHQYSSVIPSFLLLPFLHHHTYFTPSFFSVFLHLVSSFYRLFLTFPLLPSKSFLPVPFSATFFLSFLSVCSFIISHSFSFRFISFLHQHHSVFPSLLPSHLVLLHLFHSSSRCCKGMDGC